jgi:hypothetical protein
MKFEKFAFVLLIAGLACGVGNSPVDVKAHAQMENQHNPKTWSQSGPMACNTGSVVLLAADGLLQYGYAYYTVKFGVNPPPNDNGYEATATVTFKIKGNQIVRQISVGNGVEISGPADAIDVMVNDTTPTAFLNNGAPYTVTIAIAPGTRVSSTKATLIGGTLVLNASASTLIPVPQNAGVVAVQFSAVSRAAASPVPTVIGNMQASASGGLFFFGAVDPKPFEIPVVAGAIRMSVTNEDAVNQVFISYNWIIDG